MHPNTKHAAYDPLVNRVTCNLTLATKWLQCNLLPICLLIFFSCLSQNWKHSTLHEPVQSHDDKNQVIINSIYYKPVGDWIYAPSPNFIAMATSVRPQHFAWFHWIGHPQKPPGRCKHLRSIGHTSQLIGDFSPNFVDMATRVGPQHFAWFHWIGHPPKPPDRCKHLRSICHTSRLIGYFIPNFVAMATRVGPHNILYASIEQAIPENPW